MSLSRRALIRHLFRPLKAGGGLARGAGGLAGDGATVPPWVRTDRVAVIQGRFCLAYTDGYCSVCYERCPVAGAIELGEGLPKIVAETCTGCGICRDVCPAPRNAVLITARRPGLGQDPAQGEA